MKIAVVTGTTAGLGMALARGLIAAGYRVLGVSRSAVPADCPWEGVSCDLTEPGFGTAVIVDWLAALPSDSVEDALLILNAGTADPIGAVEALLPEELQRHVTLNLTAPMALTGAFLKATADWPAERRILAISSGASRRATPYWSAYTASKSGLDGFVRAVNAEYAGRTSGRASAVALAPGVIDTAMQAGIRAKDFPTVDRYRGLKERGELWTPDEAAGRILAYLRKPGFGSVELDDVRNYA